jgi:hypothetical protein
MNDTTGELKLLLGILQQDVKEIKSDVKETKEQAQKTNGRVNRHDDEFVHMHQTLLLMAETDKDTAEKLEVERVWRQRIIGGLVVMNIFLLPPMLYVINKLIDRIL